MRSQKEGLVYGIRRRKMSDLQGHKKIKVLYVATSRRASQWGYRKINSWFVESQVENYLVYRITGRKQRWCMESNRKDWSIWS